MDNRFKDEAFVRSPILMQSFTIDLNSCIICNISRPDDNDDGDRGCLTDFMANVNIARNTSDQ